MGVPGYFSWIRKKYPWLVRKVNPKGSKKQIDCLYIDVNGICYQYARDEHHFNYLLNPKTLNEILKQIIDHINSIVELISPKLQVYLMMDGPCPRAKMNQQRQRRFHAQSNHVKLKEALQKNGFDVKKETVPNNSIAPGTPFMFELNNQIRKYIETRITLTNDPKTQLHENNPFYTKGNSKLQFILSDSNAPGEGEHKILEVIRKHSNYQLTHCIAGADADLLLLSLATIGKRILILRENVRFNRDKGDIDEEVEKLRIELDKESEEEEDEGDKSKEKGEVEYDMVDINGLKRVILDRYKKMFEDKAFKHLKYNPMTIMDDFVFLSLFAGNDFLPRQNYMQIKNEKKQQHILDILIDKYDDYLEDATCYLSDRGQINFGAIINFFRHIASIEPQFKRTHIFGTNLPLSAETKSVKDYLKLLNPAERNLLDSEEENVLIDVELKEEDLQLLRRCSKHEEEEIIKDIEIPSEEELKELEEKKEDSPEIDDPKEKKGLPHHEEKDDIVEILSDELNGNERYLKEKLNLKTQDEYDLLIMKYLEGFQFTLLYYFRGIEKASWSYYYPHFYAPLTQDVVEFLERNPKFEVKFVKTMPFPPYKQLLAILHPDNVELMPTEFQGLFAKYLKEFCPEKLVIDKYGATLEHMQIIKLPFIQLDVLDKAYNEGYAALEKSTNVYDHNRNKLSEDVLLSYDVAGKIDIPVFNNLIYKTAIHNAPVHVLKFSHLDVPLPALLTELTVDVDQRNADRERFLMSNKNNRNEGAEYQKGKRGGNQTQFQKENEDYRDHLDQLHGDKGHQNNGRGNNSHHKH